MDEVTTILHHPVFAVRDRSGDLRHPQPVWTFRDAAKLNAPCGKLDEEKNQEALKSGLAPNFDSKEVGGHDLIPMSIEEFFPSCFPLSFRRGLNTVASEDVGY